MVLYNGLSKLDKHNQVGQSYPLAISYPLDKIANVYTIRHSGLESVRMRPTSSGWKTHGPTGQMGTGVRGSTPGFSGRVHSKIAGTYKKKRKNT